MLIGIFETKLQRFSGYVLMVLLFVLLLSLIRNITRARKVDEHLEEARSGLSSLEAKNKELMQALSQVRTEKYVEDEAREKLGLVYEGEVVIILPDEEVLRKLSPKVVEEEIATLPDPHWKKWLKLFL